MYPLDRLPEFQRAVLEAEQAWMRWRKSPPGNPDQEAQGEVLLQALLDAMAAYQAYAREQTIQRRDNAARRPAGSPLVPDGVTQATGLDIPAFLRRETNN